MVYIYMLHIQEYRNMKEARGFCIYMWSDDLLPALATSGNIFS